MFSSAKDGSRLAMVLQIVILTYCAAEEADIVCASGRIPTGILVTSLGGNYNLVEQTNYIIDHLVESNNFPYPAVTIASFISLTARTTMDSPFFYNGYEVTLFTEWHWCEVDSHSRAGSILSVADAFRKTMDGLPVERKFIIVIIDTNLSESKIMFLQYLGDLRSNATTVIPIDIAGANGKYEMRQLAKAGGYLGSSCLFCGGLTEHQLLKCEEELKQITTCQT